MTSDEDDLVSQVSSPLEGKSFKKKLHKLLEKEKVLPENGTTELSEGYMESPKKVKKKKIKSEPVEKETNISTDYINGASNMKESASEVESGSAKKTKKKKIKIEQSEGEISTANEIRDGAGYDELSTLEGSFSSAKRSKNKNKANTDNEESLIAAPNIVKQEMETSKKKKNKRKAEDTEHSEIFNYDNPEESFSAPKPKKHKKHSSGLSDVQMEENIKIKQVDRSCDQLPDAQEPKKKKKKSISFSNADNLELTRESAKKLIRKHSFHLESSDQEQISESPKRKHKESHNSSIASPQRKISNSSNSKLTDSLHYESSDADNVCKRFKSKFTKPSSPEHENSGSPVKNRQFSTSSIVSHRSRSSSPSPRRKRSESSSSASQSSKRKISTSSATKRTDSSSSRATNRKNSTSSVCSSRSRSRSASSSPRRNRSVSSSSNNSVPGPNKNSSDKKSRSSKSGSDSEEPTRSPKKIPQKSPKSRVSISEKILFEEDLEVIQNSSDEFKDTDKLTSKKYSLLQKFIAKNPKLKPVKAISSEFAIDSDDEAWVMKCPVEFDTSKLKDMEITIDTKTKIRIDGKTYVGRFDESSPILSILTPSVKNKGKFVIRNIKPNNTVTFRKRIPMSSIDEARIQSEHTSRESISVLPETKQRHPLFGYDYKKFIAIPPAITERLSEVHSPEKKVKSKSKKSIKDESKVEEDDVPEKKKKKRKRKLSDAGASETEVKKVKREHSKKGWETEKAIEESLFNF